MESFINDLLERIREFSDTDRDSNNDDFREELGREDSESVDEEMVLSLISRLIEENEEGLRMLADEEMAEKERSEENSEFESDDSAELRRLEF